MKEIFLNPSIFRLLDNEVDGLQQNQSHSIKNEETVVIESNVVSTDAESQCNKRKIEEAFEDKIEIKKTKVENIDKLSLENFKNPVEYDEDCWECKDKYLDPPRDYLIMYLHALSYKV